MSNLPNSSGCGRVKMDANEPMFGMEPTAHADAATEIPSLRLSLKYTNPDIAAMSIEMSSDTRNPDGSSPPSQDNCDSRHENSDSTISISSTTRLAGQTVAPFLAKHIPQQYAPLGVQEGAHAKSQSQKDPNTKYCYRHRPDLKCRRTADEPSMENLQRVGVLNHLLLITNGFRIWKHCRRPINKASLMSGPYFPLLPRNIETLCFKASSHNVAFLNCHIYLLPFAT